MTGDVQRRVAEVLAEHHVFLTGDRAPGHRAVNWWRDTPRALPRMSANVCVRLA